MSSSITLNIVQITKVPNLSDAEECFTIAMSALLEENN